MESPRSAAYRHAALLALCLLPASPSFAAPSSQPFLNLMAGGATLTNDPLTGLPLHPATDSRLHLGNEPTRLPVSTVCGSTMRADFYSVFDATQGAIVAWYAARLRGFRRTHAYAASRLQDTFYNADGTIIVSVSGVHAGRDENSEAYSILYARLGPGLPEKVIVSLNQQRVVCQ
jgi:hypothetical protein